MKSKLQSHLVRKAILAAVLAMACNKPAPTTASALSVAAAAAAADIPQ